MSKRLSLLERYEIDIEKLDYGYIAECENGCELEMIYKILLSNEEGFYPDLTAAAKERLAIVKPSSKYLRTEEKVLARDCAHSAVREEVQNSVEEFLKSFKREGENCNERGSQVELPCIPIRGAPASGENTIEIVPINQKGRELGRIEEIRTETLNEKELKELESIHKNRGNSFYRAKEYEEALVEYGKCIQILPTPTAYNNRAITCEWRSLFGYRNWI